MLGEFLSVLEWPPVTAGELSYFIRCAVEGLDKSAHRKK
jgi:hypothetical protein